MIQVVLCVIWAVTVLGLCPSQTPIIRVEGTRAFRYFFNSSHVAEDGQTLRLIRGCPYDFFVVSADSSVPVSHPFQIVTNPVWARDPEIAPGVKNAACSEPCVVHYNVPEDAPRLLFWQCAFHRNMFGRIEIVDPIPNHPVFGFNWQTANAESENDTNITSASSDSDDTVSYTGAIIAAFCLLFLFLLFLVSAISYYYRQKARNARHHYPTAGPQVVLDDMRTDIPQRLDNDSNLREPLSPKLRQLDP